MKKSLYIIWPTLMLPLLVVSLAQARGRRPEPEDGFPDYNKLEMRKKPQVPASDERSGKAVDAPPTLPSSPSPSAPGKWQPEDDSVPKAPPKPVFMPDEASEPPLPDAIKDTLIQGTTGH